MALRDFFRVTGKTFINPRDWLGYDTLKNHTLTIYQYIKPLFTPQKALRQETFEQAMERLELKESDIQIGIKRYRQYALVFLLLGLFFFLYGFYLLFRYISFTGWLLAIASCGLFLVNAFKYDFWAFQMKQRKLGVTFAEWQRSILGVKGDE